MTLDIQSTGGIDFYSTGRQVETLIKNHSHFGANKMNQQLVFEVLQNFNQPYAQGTGEKVRTKQRIFMHCGGPFPLECNMDLKTPADALPIGKFTLLPTAYRVGKYGSPEINTWELRANLVPYQPVQSVEKKAS